MSPSLPFARFLDALRAHKLPLGVRDYCVVGKLLAQWDGTNRVQLRDSLAALLASNSAEMQTIGALFEQHFPAAAPPSPPPPQLPPVAGPRSWQRVFLLGVAGIVVVALAVGIGLRLRRPTGGYFPAISDRGSKASTPQVPAASGVTKPPEGKSPSGNVSYRPSPVLPRSSSHDADHGELGPPLQLTAVPVPPPLPGRESAPVARLVLLFSTIFAGLFAALYLVERRHRKIRTARQAAQQQLSQTKGPQRYLLNLGPLVPAVPREDIEEFATLLCRLCVSYEEGQQLDTERTTERAARRGYIDRPVFRQGLLRQAIVVLQDSSLLSRLFSRQFSAILDGLTHRGVPLVRYYFDEDPSGASSELCGPTEPLATLLRRHPDAPILLLTAGGRLTNEQQQPAAWIRLLTRKRRIAWLHPIPDPQLWHLGLRQGELPIRTFALTRAGLQGAAYALASDPGLRPRVRSHPNGDFERVTPAGLRRLMRVVAQVPHASLDLVEWLRQQYCPEVPAHASTFLMEMSEDTTGKTVRFPDFLVQRLVLEQRRENVGVETSVRRALLRLYRGSMPAQSDSVAHLRWRLDCAMQELMLVALGGAPEIAPDAPHPIEELQELRGGPLWESVEEALTRVTGDRRGDIQRPPCWPLPNTLPQKERERVERVLQPSHGQLFLMAADSRALRRTWVTPRKIELIIPLVLALATTIFAYKSRLLHGYDSRHTEAYRIQWSTDLDQGPLGKGKLHVQRLPGKTASQDVELVEFSDHAPPLVVRTIHLSESGDASEDLDAGSKSTQFLVRALHSDPIWVHSAGIKVPASEAYYGKLVVHFVHSQSHHALKNISYHARHAQEEKDGSADQSLQIRAGFVELSATPAGFLPFRRRISLLPGLKKTEQEVILHPISESAPARVELVLATPGVQPNEVLIDGQPWSGTAFNHPAGDLSVGISNLYFDFERRFELTAGEKRTIEVKAVPVFGRFALTVRPSTAGVVLPDAVKVIQRSIGDAESLAPIEELRMELRAPAGSYEASITATGYVPETVPIVVSTGKAAFRQVKLVSLGALDPDRDGLSGDNDRCPNAWGPAENHGCPDSDRDKDGIADRLDKCPKEPGPGQNQGCPDTDKDGDGEWDREDRCPEQVGPRENQGCPWPDTDKDGIPDKDDKCPSLVGPKGNQGCPDTDKDGDGIIDRLDRCPEQAGPLENHGCLWPDTDKDGVLDKDDKCPDSPGPKENRGCPDTDKDSDGIIDRLDLCPLQSGPRENDGCPWPDNDKDGIPDKDDQCPFYPGSKAYNGCPGNRPRDNKPGALGNLDTDKDGLLDRLDKCPLEPGPRENHGCPDKDRDNDGLVDRLDSCPDDPGPLENNGCPLLDTDKDGIPDKDDKCPYEPGPKVNDGCPPPRKFITVTSERIELLQKIQFTTDSALIRPGPSYELLDEVALVLKARPTMKVHIEGHTDSRGTLQANINLSSLRAQAVRRYLINRGVGAERMTSEGYGPTRPIGDNMTKSGQDKNRRTEFVIVQQ